MTLIAGLCSLLLSWSLGKNNLGDLFGAAVGTQMLRLKSASILAAIFVVLGAVISSTGTTATISKISHISSLSDIVIVLLSAILILEYLSNLGIPVSIVQTMIGSLIGWNLYSKIDIEILFLKKIAIAWIFAPIIASFISFTLMKIIRRLLYHYPLPLLIRDSILRIGLICIGSWAAYTLGANNTSVILAPYIKLFSSHNITLITSCVSIAIGIGFFMADKKVISTVGNKLFPLSPTEAFVAMFGCVISMTLFSIQSIRELFIFLHIPTLPLVPIPMSIVVIGAICGISLSKGGKGLRFSVLSHIILSWFLVPVFTGGLCYLFLMFYNSLV